MNNLHRYNEVFVKVFDVQESDLNSDFTFENTKCWDSLAHVTMVAELEDVFDILLDSEDILNFGSYENGKNILLKYGIAMEG